METRRRRLRGAATAGLALLLLSGCAAQEGPAVALSGVRVAERTAEAVALHCDLVLVNPNETETIPLDEVRYTLSIDGDVAYSGRRAAQATLSPGERRRMSLPAVVPASRLRAGAVGYTLKGTVRYRAPTQLARLLFDMKVQRPKQRFEGTGTLVVGDR